MSTRTFTERLTLTAGAAALAAIPGQANAWLTTVSTPVSGGNWDVDGDGAPEFKVHTYRTNQLGDVYTWFLDSGAGFNGRGFVKKAGNHFSAMAILPFSVAVGATLQSLYQWGAVDSSRAIAGSFDPNNTYWVTGSATANNFIAFRFDSGEGLQYGWAVLRYDQRGYVPQPSIIGWTYNTTPGEQVHVGVEAPVPPSIVPALTLLGLGAAGLRGWRKRQARPA